MKKLTIRLEDEVYEELDTLSNLSDLSKNEIVNNLIRVEAHKVKEDPKVKLLIEQAKELKETFKRMNDELEAAGIKNL